MYIVIIVILCDSFKYIYICYIRWIMYIDFCAITNVYIYIMNIEYEDIRCSSKIWIEHED